LKSRDLPFSIEPPPPENTVLTTLTMHGLRHPAASVMRLNRKHLCNFCRVFSSMVSKVGLEGTLSRWHGVAGSTWICLEALENNSGPTK